ncbi:MAG: class I SAM-dependent methyltransferase [Bradyrhizobium sp.]|uniref:class I SAM-dependent methyltransferase n=1 Tax=Bradyrhizobium sp. TaxID=376 RepID=UPI003D13AF2B
MSDHRSMVRVKYTDLLHFGLRIADEHQVALGMVNHHHPFSITEDEFAFIGNHVRSRGYRSAYEVATGFGVSAAAIGLGLQARGGKLLSVDAYIEEAMGHASAYRGRRRECHHGSDGMRIAEQLRAHFGLTDTVEFRVGWSPDDIPHLLGERTLDFAFIDGGHFEHQVLADVEVIRDRMVPPFTVMLHDTGAIAEPVLTAIRGWLGVPMVRPRLAHTYHLGMFEVLRR